MSQKIVLKVELNCEKCIRRAMKTLAGIEGVVSLTVDEKDKKITIIGDADPVCLTDSLRKFGFAELLSVGPSKPPEEKKPDAGKKQPEKPEPGKKQPEKPETDKKPPDQKKPAEKQESLQQNITYVILPTSCDHSSSYTYYWSEENPSSCCIV